MHHASASIIFSKTTITRKKKMFSVLEKENVHPQERGVIRLMLEVFKISRRRRGCC